MAAADRRRPGTGRTWGERVAIGATIVAAVVCFLDRRRRSSPATWCCATARSSRSPTRPSARRPPTTPPAEPRTRRRRPRRGETRRRRRRRRRRRATFPPADPTAKNFLITGADNGACVDPDSPYAPAFGDAESGRVGERSDTIMIFRVDPAAGRVAVLSFPRDLYVTIAGSGNQAADQLGLPARRAAAADRHDLRELRRSASTTSSRSTSARSRRSSTPSAASRCRSSTRPATRTPGSTCRRRVLHVRRRPRPGLRALAQLRVRGPAGQRRTGRTDPTSDLGRISRQQDFLRRTLSSVLAKGLLNPSVARGLIEAATSGDVVTDSGLSPAKLLEFAGVLERRRAGRDPDVPDRGRAAARSTAPPCSSRGSTATTCRPCWRCSAARRRSPRRPSRCFEPTPTDVPRRRAAAPADTAPATVGPGDDGAAGRRPRREHVRHRPAPRRHLLTRLAQDAF